MAFVLAQHDGPPGPPGHEPHGTMLQQSKLQILNKELDAIVGRQEGRYPACGEKTVAKLKEQVALVKEQVTSTQLQMEETEYENTQLVSEVSKLREKLQKQKSLSEQLEQELDSVTSSRNEYRIQWQRTKEILSKKEAELVEERVRMETKVEEKKKHCEAMVARITKEKEEAQATLAMTLQRVKVLEAQNLELCQTEQELAQIRFEYDESKRKVTHLKNELARVEMLLKEKEEEFNDQFERARRESKEWLDQELTQLKKKQEKALKTLLGHHEWIPLDSELDKYSSLLDSLRKKEFCHLSSTSGMEGNGGTEENGEEGES